MIRSVPAGAFVRRIALVLAILGVLPAGATPPGWDEDDLAAAWPALLLSCGKFVAAPEASAWHAGCDAAARLSDAPNAAKRAFLDAWLEPQDHGTGLLTGYYEPELRGALGPWQRYRTALRAPPPGLAPGTVLPPRAAIEAGALDGRALPLVWVDDPVDAFFLEVQGSGRVRLTGGGVLRLGYAGRNGQPYVAIGRLLIERGAIPRASMSMQAIRAWLAAAPPDQARALLDANGSYVFFRILEGLAPEEGPLGTLQVPLTPGRSIAVDPSQVPLGAPVWIVATDPVDGTPIRRLMLAQDTGGAIRGRARGDLFFGWGEDAERRAGLMQDRAARMWVLMPRAMPADRAQPAETTGSAAAPRPLD